MRILETKFFGEKTIEESDVIHFPDGLYGFSEVKEFFIFKEKDDSPFLWLQSLEDKELAFVIIEPAMILKEYTPVVSSYDLELLSVSSIEECKIYCILTIPENNPEQMTINLQGPLLINEQKKIGRQVISLDDRHKVRMNVLELMQKQSLQG